MMYRLENRFFLLCTALVLVLNGLFYAFAAEDTEEESYTVVDGVDYACGQAVAEDAVVIVQSYKRFLDEYFQVDRPSSKQVDDAMSFYRYVRTSIQKSYDQNLNVRKNDTLESATVANNYCSYVRDQYIAAAQALLEKQVILSSNSKRTFKVVDGLKAINENMDRFSEDFNGIFPGLFRQLDHDLPCYARQCIVQ